MTDVTARLSNALADRYRIERHLGEGGMATVYLAQDLKHDRKVAVKVLRPELAAVLGAERFVQEIKTTASLQHPHILPLFDSGEADNFLFYVMPYIEGETLRDKLNRETQLGIDEAVRITTEIADALDYAHRHNVIHRDIKPENILLHDGRPMVADFGIALAVSAAAGGRMTETGMSLGTPHYMSPEQATADRDLTSRSDIYSLASVLHEMLTGDPPHTGSSAQQVIMKIIAEPVQPVTKLRKSVPPHVAAAVVQALEKLPADRFDSAATFAAALANPAFTLPANQAAVAAAPRAGGPWNRLSVSATAVATILLVAAVWGWLRPVPAPPVSRQRVMVLDEWQPLTGSAQTYDGTVAMAPDGSSIVFWDSSEAGIQLMRKMRDEALPVPLTGTQGAVSPFFSPDGAWIGYATRDGRLRKVPSDGGGALTLTEDVNEGYRNGAWTDDDHLLYIDARWDVSRVPASGGTSEVVAALGTTGMLAATVEALPGSKGFLFTGCPGNCTQSNVYVYDLKADSARMLFEDASGVWYAPTGHVLYTARDGGLFAAAFDVKALEVRGGAIPVLDDVGPAQFAFSATGVALYQTGGGGGLDRDLVWVTRDGTVEPIDPGWRGQFMYPALSPDGTRVAVSLSGDETHLWIKQIGAGEQKLTFEGAVNWRPTWTPDGRTVTFVSNRGTTADDNALYTSPADGNTRPELFLKHRTGIWEGEYSRDGQWLVVRTDDAGANSNIYALRLGRDTIPGPVVIRESLERTVALSPDGQWLAYASNESGQFEIYVVPFPEADSRQLVSVGGAQEPRWAHSGRELFFKSGGMLVVVDVEPGSPPTFGEPQPLFSVEGYLSAQNRHQYDVAPDDDRFVMIRVLDRAEEGEVVYVENWFEELRAKVGN